MRRVEQDITADESTTPGRNRKGGYILVEAAVAMVLLSIGAYAIHSTMREALITRGQAQDYTHARFLLDNLVGELELQPKIQQEVKQGTFSAPYERFSWKYRIRKIELPKPEPPPNPDPEWEPPEEFEFSLPYLVVVMAEVSWERAGRKHSETFETIFDPLKLWIPPEERDDERGGR